MSKSTLRTVLLSIFAVLSVGCSAIEREHGYIPSAEDLKKVVIGVDNKFTLAEVIGAPQARGMLEDGNWYYVRSRVHAVGIKEPQVVDREVLAISFNKDGTVSNIERFGLEDGRIITLSRRVTALPVKGPRVLSQVFGSFGNFQASDFVQN